MNIVEVCKIKYPGQIEEGNINFRQPDDEILIGEWNVPGVPRPKESDLLAEIKKLKPEFELNLLKSESSREISKLIEATAISRQYDCASSLISYANSTHDAWKAEALAFIAWRDSVYVYAYDVLSQVDVGSSIPTVDEFIAKLPTIKWPT